MQTLSIAERLEQIEQFASRARSQVTVLIQYFCIPDRPSVLDDEHLVGVLEHVEEDLQRIRDHSRLPDPLAGPNPNA